jgi:hypothetical protein
VIRKARRKNIVGRRVAEARKPRSPRLTQEDLSGKLARVGIPLDRTAVPKIENGHRYVLDYELGGSRRGVGSRRELVPWGSEKVGDSTSQLRSATRKAKSDAANKLIWHVGAKAPLLAKDARNAAPRGRLSDGDRAAIYAVGMPVRTRCAPGATGILRLHLSRFPRDKFRSG